MPACSGRASRACPDRLPTRRCVLAGLAAAAAGPAFSVSAQDLPGPVPDWSLRAQQRLVGGPGSDPDERRRLMDEGERRLAARDAAGAEAAFDRAALMLHAADTEIALVRTYLQLGQYRRALAFCAHAAGVHRDVVAAAALYVWLLDLGGQGAVALQRLAEAETLYPAEPLLAAVRRQLDAAPPRADGPLRALPARLAPYAEMPAAATRVAGGAVLLPDARLALAPAALVGEAAQVWLRNGLGDTVEAAVDRPADLPALALLRPHSALPGVPEAAPAPRDPYAGRPGFIVGQAARPDAQSEWPRLRMGFLGAVLREPGRRRLGLSLPGAEPGALVLDEHGRFAGLALDAGTWLPASALQPWSRATPAPDAGERVAPDAACERGMRLALQLLVPQ